MSSTIIFGANALSAALGFQERGVPNIMAAIDVDSLESPAAGVGSFVLAFAHDVPGGWVGRDPNEWTQALMLGTSIGMMEMRSPDIRFTGNKQDTHAMLLLHWDSVDTEHALRVARAIERSYAGLSG
jgi:hypothetical protein